MAGFQTPLVHLISASMTPQYSLLILFIATLVNGTALWFMVDTAQSEAVSVGDVAALAATPFGGLNTSSITCSCSENGCTAVYVGFPTPATTALYCPQTKLYREYAPVVPGAWNLGQHTPGGSCRVYAGAGCGSVPVQGIMYHEGTSLPGAAGA